MLSRVATIRLLVASLALNALFVAAGGYVLHRKGGIKYLKNYRAILRGDAVTIETFPHYYRNKYSEFWGEPVVAGSTIFVGDSLTEQHDWSSFCRKPVLNRGIGADTSLGIHFRLGEMIRHRPQMLFVMAGIADLRIGRSVDRILEAHANILTQMGKASPQTKLFVQSVLPINPDLFGREIDPSNVSRINDGLRALSAKHGATYVDIYSRLQESGTLARRFTNDGVHLTDAGYREWEAALAAAACSAPAGG
ncbi:MAG TPA: GDSL-type esterase/lipase family protein [Polyangia bacterium]